MAVEVALAVLEQRGRWLIQLRDDIHGHGWVESALIVKRMLALFVEQILGQQQQRHPHQGEGRAALRGSAHLQGAGGLQMLRPAQSHPQAGKF